MNKQKSILGIKFPKIEINGKNPSSVAKDKIKLNEINETNKVILITGLSGAGRTSALKILEDIGYEAIDNLQHL